MAVPLLLGEGGATASGLARPGEGRAKREPDRVKPQERSSQILPPSPYPLPEGEGDFARCRFLHTFTPKLLLLVLLVSGILYGQGQPVEKISPDVRTIQKAVNDVVGTPIPGGGVLQVAKGAYLNGYGIVVSLEVAFDPPVNPFSPQKTPEEIRTTAAQRLKDVQEKLTNVLKQKVAQLESVGPAESVSVVLNILNTNPAYLPDMPSQIIFSVKKQDTARVSLRQYK